MRARRRKIAAKYLHEQYAPKPVPSCECDKCLNQIDEQHWGRVAETFGLTEADLDAKGEPDDRG